MPDHSSRDNIGPLLRLGLDPTPQVIRLEEGECVTQPLVPGSPQVSKGPSSGERIGPYELVSVLGEGGFGIVWRAEQQEPILREVALKVIKPGMDSREIIARFEGERQALALMDHPHIAAVLDAGKTASGLPYFAMELVRGVPLTEHCDAQRLTLRQRLELFIPVCQAVQHAHQKGVLHRDLKPSNILVEMVDGKAVPKVIDFGIAKALQTGSEAAPGLSLLRTQGLSLIGTPLYMSPEQAGLAGLDVDSRSDIYSLGVVLYELLTGSTPMSRDTLKKAAADEVLRLIREQDPPSLERRLLSLGLQTATIATQRQTELRKLTAQVRGDLQWIVVKALEKDRERRYASASALAEDIQHHLHDEPVSAGPPGAAYRMRKMARRHKGALIAASFVVVSLFIGLGLALWQAVRATKAEHIAEARLDDAQKARDSAQALVSEGIHGMRDKLLALGKVELMEDMVKAAENYYRGLPAEVLHDDETQRHLASLALNRATIALALGRDAEHEQHTQECLRITEALLARHPEREDLADEACFAMLSMCYLYTERSDQAGLIPMCDAVVNRCGTWLERHPDTLWAMYYQALAHNLAAQAHVRVLKQVMQAQVRFQQATQITRRMREVHGEHARVCEAEGLIHYGNANVAGKLKQEEIELREFQASEASFAIALALGGDSALLREAHLGAMFQFGGKLRSRGRRTNNAAEIQRGEELTQKALEGRRRLVELEPGRGEWWRDLAHTHAVLAVIAAEHQDEPAALAARQEALRCREEAVARSPKRPLLIQERSTSHLDLARALLRVNAEDTAGAVPHFLSALRDMRAAIEMSGMRLPAQGVQSKQAALTLAEMALKQPKEGLAWLEQASHILEPLADKVEDFDARTSLGHISTAQQKVLKALGMEKEAAAMAQRQQAVVRELATAKSKSEHARALIDTANGDFSRALKLTGQEKTAAMAAIVPSLNTAVKLAEEALAAEPVNVQFRDTLGYGLRNLGACLHHQKLRLEALDAFEKSLRAYDPVAHRVRLLESHGSCTRLLMEMQDHAGAEKHARAATMLADAICAHAAPPPAASDFQAAAGAWQQLGQVISPPEARLAALQKAVGYARKSLEMEPVSSFNQWELRRKLALLAEQQAALKALSEAQETTTQILAGLPALAQLEKSGATITAFANERLQPLIYKLRDANLLSTAVDACRVLIILRQRLEALGISPTESAQILMKVRIDLAALLMRKGSLAEADAEIKEVIAQATNRSPATLAEAHHYVRYILSAAGRNQEAERHARAAYDISTRHDLGWWRPFYANLLCLELQGLGKLEEAEALALSAWDEAAKTRWPGEAVSLRADLAGRICNLHHSLYLKQPDSSRDAGAREWVRQWYDALPLEKQLAAGNFTSATSHWMAALAEDGQNKDYQALRTQWLKLKKPSANDDMQSRITLAALLLPAEGEELKNIIASATAAHASKPNNWTALTQALALIRAEKARDALPLITPYLNGDLGRWFVAHALAALAHRHMGQPAEAEVFLKKIASAPEDRQRFLTSPTNREAIMTRLLIREAQPRSGR